MMEQIHDALRLTYSGYYKNTGHVLPVRFAIWLYAWLIRDLMHRLGVIALNSSNIFFTTAITTTCLLIHRSLNKYWSVDWYDRNLNTLYTIFCIKAAVLRNGEFPLPRISRFEYCVLRSRAVHVILWTFLLCGFQNCLKTVYLKSEICNTHRYSEVHIRGRIFSTAFHIVNCPVHRFG